NVSSGILRVVFTAASGTADEVVVAGRVRIENAANRSDNRIVSYKTPASDLLLYGDTYTETPAVLFEVTDTPQVANMIAELEAAVLAGGQLASGTVIESVFANPGSGITPEPLIGGDDDQLAVVSELIPGQKWLISNVEPVNPDSTNATAYTERYAIELTGDGNLVVSMDWQSIAYPTGNGNFPLWESETLRDSAFRQLFRDWSNGDVSYQEWLDAQGAVADVPNNFPDLGDEPTADPVGALGGVAPMGAFLPRAAYLTPPVLNASGTYVLDYNGGQVDLADLALLGAGASFVEYNVDGQLKRDLVLDRFAFADIDQNAVDTTVTIDGTNTAIIVDNIIIKGFLGSVGFEKLNIIAKESIVIEDDAMLSSRFVSTVTAETDYVTAASEGNSGNIILKAPKIIIGDNASVLANADGTYNAGFIHMEAVVLSGPDAPVVEIGNGATLLATAGDGDYGTVAVETLTNPDPVGAPIELFEGDISVHAYKPVTQTWEFFGIDGFNWLSSEARIEIGGDTDLSGNNIKINTKATTDKQAILDSVDFAGATTSLAYADLNADGYMDLIMGNHDQVNRLMLNDGTGKYLPGINISADKNDTTAVAAGDVNLDGLADIIVGNSGSGQLLLNNGSGFAAGNNPFVASTGLINLDGLNISAFALDDVDNDGDEDLVVGVNGGANLLYLNQGLNASDVWLGFASGAAIGGGEAQDTTSLALGDLDGDSDLDLVVGNYDQANRVYLFDSASHSYLAGTDILSGETDNTTSIALGDVNNDGAKDVVFGNDLLVGGDRNRVFLGNGAGGFIADAGDPAAGYIPNEYHHTKAVTLSDINNDGFDDLVEGNDGESTRVYLSDGVGGFTSGIDITAAAFPTSALALFDANNDGDKDLVVANNRGVNQLYEMGGTLAFDSQADVDALNNTINLGSSLHGLVDGDAVIFRTDGAALSTNGLSDKTTYYVDVVDAFPALVRLFASRAEALVGDTATAVVLTEDTATDSSSYRFEMAGITRTFNSVADVDAANNTIHFATAQHGLTNGGVVLFRTGDASASAIGLNDKSAYYVGIDDVDPANIRLFTSRADALSGDTSLAVGLSADAGAGVEHTFQTIAFQPGVGLDVDQELVHSLDIDNDGVVLSTDKAVGVVSEALAKIIIGHGADFNAVQDIYLQSHAISQTKVETYRSAFGVTYGNSSPTALVIVENGANLFAGGDFTMNALTNNELKVDTFVPSLGEKTNIAFSVGWARSISEADLQSGATVKAANATIEAHNENSFENRAYAHGFGTDKESESGFSATLALGFYQSEADATVSGNVEIGTPTTPGVLNIFAVSENVKNITQTYSSVSGNPANQYVEDLRSQSRGTLSGAAFDGSVYYELTYDFSKIIDENLGQFETGTATDQYAAAMAYVMSDNNADAIIDDGAFVTVYGTLNLEASALDSFQVSASSTVGTIEPPTGSGIAGSFVFAKASNQADAFISWKGIVDASQDLNVHATAELKSPVSGLDLAWNLLGLDALAAEAMGGVYAYGQELGNAQSDIGQSIGAEVNSQLQSSLANNLSTIQSTSDFGTSFINAAGRTDSGTSINGGVALIYTNNSATSGIASGAKVNRRLNATTLANPSAQNVNVTSDATMDLVNLGGQFSLLSYLFNNTSDSYGGFVEVIRGANSSIAYIDDLADVSAAHDINISADSQNLMLSFAMAGAEAEGNSIGGSFVYNKLVTTTLAYIEDRATVLAGNDIVLHANTDVDVISISGNFADSGSIGVGVSSSIAIVKDKTQAFIGDSVEPVAIGGYGAVLGSVTADNNLTIVADSLQEVWGLAIAAGFANGDSNQSSGGTQTRLSVGSPGDASYNGTGGSFGFGLSGDVVYSSVTQDTQAFIRDAVTVTVANLLTVNALSELALVAASGGFASAQGAAVSASYTNSRIKQTTKAFIENANILGNADVNVHADSNNLMVTLAVGGSSATSNEDIGGGLAIAGSVNDNEFTFTTEAYIGNGAHIGDATTKAGNVTVEALHDSELISIAGEIAFASGEGDTSTWGAAGVAIDMDTITNNVTASIA
ncbi:MAG: hypothetical protein AMJ53_13520, partial [Gammaproteobacteria bacterium SG8_11]